MADGRLFQCCLLKPKTFLNIPEEVVLSMEDGVDAVGIFIVVEVTPVTKLFFSSIK